MHRYESSLPQLSRPRTRRIFLLRPSAPRRPVWRKRRIPHFRLRWPHLPLSHSRSNGRSREPRWLCILRFIARNGGNKMNTDISQNESLFYRTLLALGMILLAAALRIAPHPWNFTPVGAMALFSRALIPDRRLSFVFPLLTLFIGDIFICFHNLISAD